MGARIRAQHLTDTGTTGGAFDANGDYSVTPKTFYWTVPANTSWELHRIIITIIDGGTWGPTKYGNITGGVANGWHLDIDGVYNVNDKVIQTNADLNRYAYDFQVQNYGTGDLVGVCRLTLAKFGGPVILKPADTVNIELSDDYSALTHQYFVIEGRESS